MAGVRIAMADSDVGRDDFSPVLRILHVWTRTRAITRVSEHVLEYLLDNDKNVYVKQRQCPEKVTAPRL